jgi:hypothetical protein
MYGQARVNAPYGGGGGFPSAASGTGTPGLPSGGSFIDALLAALGAGAQGSGQNSAYRARIAALANRQRHPGMGFGVGTNYGLPYMPPAVPPAATYPVNPHPAAPAPTAPRPARLF